MRRVSGGLEKWRGASSLSQDLTQNLVEMGRGAVCGQRNRPHCQSVLGTACGRRPTSTAEMTNTAPGRFQQDDLVGCPDLGRLLWDDFFDPWCGFLWKAKLLLGPSWDFSQPCPCLTKVTAMLI